MTPKSAYDARIASVLESYLRRIEAMPPGICPIAVQLNLLEAGGAQTCGKCVPFHFQDGNSNWLTIAALDNIAKAPEFKVCAVKVEKV